MNTNFMKSLRMLRYSDGFITNILLGLLSLAGGLYLLFVHDSAIYGCVFIAMAPVFMAYGSASLTMTDSIAASPKRKIFAVDIPNVLTFLGIVVTYIFLYIAFDAKLEDNVSYGGEYVDMFCSFYYKGIYAIFITTICMALISRYSYALLIYIGLLLPSEYMFDMLSFSMLESSSGCGIHTFLMQLIGIVMLVAGYVASIVIRQHFDEKPFSALLTKANSKKSLLKLRIPLTICIILAGVCIGVGWYMHINSKQPDGWYDKEALKNEYTERLQNCGEKLEFENFTVILAKQYYNATTGDGYFIIEFVPNEDYNSFSHEADSNNGTIRVGSDYSGYKLTMAIDGEGVIDIANLNWSEYSSSYAIHSTAFGVYVNTMPDEDNEGLSIYFIEESSTDDGDTMNVTDRQELVLKDSSNCAVYTVGGTEINVSAGALLFHDHLDLSELYISMKNGDKLTIVEDSALIKGFERLENETTTKYCFNELIDVSDIDEIVYEGTKSTIDMDEATLYSVNETYNMKQSFYVEPVEGEENLVKCTINIQWTQMPRYRESDFINIDLTGASLYSEDDVKVTGQVYETLNDNQYTGHWLQAQYTQYGYNAFCYYAAQNSFLIGATNIAPNTYGTIKDESTCVTVCVALHSDTSSNTYTDESITIELLLELDEDSLIEPSINCAYLHQKLQLSSQYDGVIEITEDYCGIIGNIFNQRLR